MLLDSHFYYSFCVFVSLCVCECIVQGITSVIRKKCHPEDLQGGICINRVLYRL